jgi:hypothetical protein
MYCLNLEAMAPTKLTNNQSFKIKTVFEQFNYNSKILSLPINVEHNPL